MTSARLVVRACTPDDASTLAELGARTFSDTFAADNMPADMAAYLTSSFSAAIQAREIADPATTFLLAGIDDEAVGYARLRSGPAPECVVGKRPVEIVRFYVDAPWIGQGVSAVLMQACLTRALGDNHDTVWLDVWERNPRAIAFYAKWGFCVVGRQTFLLGSDVQDDLLMARSSSVR